jgi:hypothetical protein
LLRQRKSNPELCGENLATNSLCSVMWPESALRELYSRLVIPDKYWRKSACRLCKWSKGKLGQCFNSEQYIFPSLSLCHHPHHGFTFLPGLQSSVPDSTSFEDDSKAEIQLIHVAGGTATSSMPGNARLASVDSSIRPHAAHWAFCQTTSIKVNP